LALITAGVILPFADDVRARELLDPLLRDRCLREEFWKYNPISGRKAISEGRIDLVFPESTRTSSRLMSEDLAEDLRGWLVEPGHSQSQRRPLPLDRNQRSLAETRTETGYRRIKGPAGSGKSLVLAARAANLIAEGKDVLVVSFNITLWHYLRDMVERGLHGRRGIGSVTYNHFHGWCRDICEETGRENEYTALRDSRTLGQLLNEDLPRLAARRIDDPQGADLQRYDAIIVDEGQDFLPLWWNVLRKVARAGAEYLLAADATQDIYGTSRSWTDEAMRGAGFPGGRWAELKTSYRMPPELVPLAREFASRFLPRDIIDLPEPKQMELAFAAPRLKWKQVAEGEELDAAIQCLREMMTHCAEHPLAYSDIVLLCQDHETGLALVNRLTTLGVEAAHTFGEDWQTAKRHKKAFWMGGEKVKASTFHSFKGWEGSAVIAIVEDMTDAKARALIYTGLTRLKHSADGCMLSVVSSSSATVEFAKLWPTAV